MPEIVRAILYLLFAVVLNGCAAFPEYPDYSIATEHYRDVNRFDRISVLVTTIRMGGAEKSFSESVKKEIAHYLEQNGIEFVSTENPSSEQAATLDLLISPHGGYLTINASLRAPDGNVIEETPLFHKTTVVPSIALAQQIASLVVDDLILLWYPSAAAGAGGQSSTSPAKFTILMNETEPQSIGGITRLSWEAFPSQRLFEGSGLSSSEISDVSYEIRLRKAGERAGPPRWLSVARRRSGARRRFAVPRPRCCLS